ncbi:MULTISPECIES: hypothetical protein [Pseudonocardia]|uniref:Uncharacterized protein n=1 Tax=Pseudonocardia xishanensis TaxID=630995 RepID=A0ABP8RYM5_9PSEU|nr:hypothetical protein [Pseudonocardia sp. WMMC193]MCF7547204.1 hypothetical protein [Pseudonocardia sp. WMMC193]
MTAGALAGIGSIAGLALIIGLWLYLHKNAPKFTTLLFLLAGTGIGGLAGAAIAGGVGTVTSTAASATSRLVGFSAAALVSAICIVATLEVVVKGLWKRTATPKRYHPWLALALPTIAVAGGVPIISSLISFLSGAMGEAGAALTQLSVG